MDDHLREVLCCYLAVRYLKRRRLAKKKRCWVLPHNSQRHTHGHFSTVYKSLRKDPSGFRDYFGMTIDTFDELLGIVGVHIKHRDTTWRSAISPEEMLVITIRYLYSGCSFKEIHQDYRVGRSTIGGMIHTVCTAIWQLAGPLLMPKPSEALWLAKSEEFFARTNFPNCIGAVGHRRLRLTKKVGQASSNVGLLAIVDTDFKFVYAEVGPAEDFRQSALWKAMEAQELSIPPPAALPSGAKEEKKENVEKEEKDEKKEEVETEEEKEDEEEEDDSRVPFSLVADTGFCMSANILRPYSGNHLPPDKKVFNFRLARARRCCDSAFALLSSRWKVFQQPVGVSFEFAADIVRCCCLLHNFVLDREGYDAGDAMSIAGFEDFEDVDAALHNKANYRARAALSRYFTSEEGKLPWQHLKLKD